MITPNDDNNVFIIVVHAATRQGASFVCAGFGSSDKISFLPHVTENDTVCCESGISLLSYNSSVLSALNRSCYFSLFDLNFAPSAYKLSKRASMSFGLWVCLLLLRQRSKNPRKIYLSNYQHGRFAWT